MKIGVLIILGAFLLWPSAAQQQQAKPHAAGYKSIGPKQIVPPTHVVIDPPFPAITNSQPQPTNTQAQTPDEPLPRFLRPEWVIVFITAVYVFFTGLMLLTIRRQANTMDRQAKDATKAADAAALSAQNTLNEIKRQADLMDAQVKAMDDSRMQVNRQIEILESSVVAGQMSARAAKLSADVAARVSVPTLVIEKFEPADAGAANLAAMLQYPNVKIVIKNYGQTPALLKFWNIVFTCEELPAEPQYWNQPGSGIMLERDVIEPNQSYTIPPINSWRRAELSLDDVKAISTNKKKLWAYGFICYDDIFGQARWRMKFCEFALNVREGWIQWISYLSPPIYHGTEEFPWGLAQSEGQKADNPNEPEQPN